MLICNIFIMQKKWIEKAIKIKWALRKQLGAKEWKNIPKADIKEASKASGKLGMRARLAMTLAKIRAKKK